MRETVTDAPLAEGGLDDARDQTMIPTVGMADERGRQSRIDLEHAVVATIAPRTQHEIDTDPAARLRSRGPLQRGDGAAGEGLGPLPHGDVDDGCSADIGSFRAVREVLFERFQRHDAVTGAQTRHPTGMPATEASTRAAWALGAGGGS